MSAAAPSERNNNDIITPFDVTEPGTGASLSLANTLWVKLTPQVLKVIIVVLTTAVIACTTVTVVIIVTHFALSESEPVETTTTPLMPTPFSTTTTTTTTTISTTVNSTASTPSNITITTSSTTPVSSSANVSSSATTPSTASSTTVSSPSSSSSSSSPSSPSSSSSSSNVSEWSSTSTTPALNVSSSTASTTASTTVSTTTVPACAQTQFLCGSGECIPWKQLCDGLPHCQDGSDEGVDCVCGSDQWKCSSGQCIPADARCNKFEDCRDSSDEMLCPDCSGFQCDTGLCLWDGHQRRCNGVFDCSDLSDEMGCSPRAGTRLCNNTVRVLRMQWCDGLDDCGDNSDETNCGARCRGLRTACSDGQCIMRTWRCDGYTDCEDGSDEVGCGTCLSTEFMCDNYQCISESAVCDGNWDCKTGEDELHCFSVQEENSGVLSVRYQGQDYAVCADEWNSDFAVQICTDIDQLQLADWKEVSPSSSVTRFVAFTNNTLSAQTTNLAIRTTCESGKVIYLTCHNEECGNRKVPFLQSFVAGGQIVSPGKWPWVVSLLHLGKFICGGSLISPSWVVTAAHCILKASEGKETYNFAATPFYFDVVLGSTHRMGQSRMGTPVRIRVGEIYLYPNLTRPVTGGVDGDVALLKLSVAVTYTDYIQPLCLPHQGQSMPLTSLCYLAGWGLMNPQQVVPTENLRDTRMQLWSDTRCVKNTVPGEDSVNTNTTLCGGFIFSKPSSCEGDSGGPLMCLAANGRWMMAGVVSRGNFPCGKYHPNNRANRFARVANMVDWIRQQTAET